MPKQPQTPIMPQPGFEAPELFFEIAGRLVPSEAAAPSPEIFSTEVVAAVRAATSRDSKPVYDPLSETIKRRRATIAQERIDYLTEHPEELEQRHPAVEDVVDTVVPMVLQGTLFEVNSDATPKPEGKKVAFGRYVKSAIYKVAGEVFSYALTTEDERKMMTPKGLSRILMPPSAEVKEDDLVVDGLLLNQVEYRLIPRSPKHVARNSSAKTYGQRDVAENPDVHDRAKRSITHTFERMLPGMAEHR